MSNRLQKLNHPQKIIVTVWVILIALIFICTISPVERKYMGVVVESWWAVTWNEFVIGSIIISIPCLIIFLIWGNKKITN